MTAVMMYSIGVSSDKPKNEIGAKIKFPKKHTMFRQKKNNYTKEQSAYNIIFAKIKKKSESLNNDYAITYTQRN